MSTVNAGAASTQPVDDLDERREAMKKIFFAIILLTFGFSGCRPEMTLEDKQKVEELRAELLLVQNDIKETQAKDAEYVGGAIKSFFALHLEQAKITETLLQQQIASIETGAKVDIRPIQTTPDPALAAQLEKEIEKLKIDIRVAEKEAEKYVGGLVLATITVQIAGQNMTLATLQQRRLAAQYGFKHANRPSQSSFGLFVHDATAFLNEIDDPQPVAATEPTISNEVVGEKKVDENIVALSDLVSGMDGNWEVIGNWAVKEPKESVMGDAKDITILNISPVLHNAGYSHGEKQALLSISCKNNKTDLSVGFRTMIQTSLSDVALEYKIDEQKINKAKWISATSYQAAFSPRPIPLIKELIAAKKIAFRVPVYNSSAVMETYFNMEGLGEAIKPVQEVCGWE